MATYQSVTAGDVIDVEPHLARADSTLAAAELLAREGFHTDAVARAHQCTIHAERALLATEKRNPTTVWSVHRLAASHFHKPNRLARDHSAQLSTLAILRGRVDDQPVGEAEAADAEGALVCARALLADVRAWLESHDFLDQGGAA